MRKWIQHTGENRLRWEQGLLAQVTEGRSAHGTDARGITDLMVEAPQSSLEITFTFSVREEARL